MGVIAPFAEPAAGVAGPHEGVGVGWPLVSVVITCYNYARYIGACLGSIQRQNYPRFECVVVDDCSNDGSAELVEQFIRQHGLAAQFSLVRHERNRGQLAAFRTGLQASEGPFVVFVDADDLLHENFLATHVAAHLRVSPVAFTCSNQYQVDEHAELIGGAYLELRPEQGAQRVEPRCLFRPAWIWATTSSMMFRRAALEAILPQSGADDEFRRCADYYICHFSNLLGGSVLLPELLAYYRRHGANCFSTNRLIGARLPPGDMRTHPTHRTVVSVIRRHVLAHWGDFAALLTERGAVSMLSRITPPGQAAALALRALARRAGTVPLRLALRLLRQSCTRYATFVLRSFCVAAPFAQLKVEPAEHEPRR